MKFHFLNSNISFFELKVKIAKKTSYVVACLVVVSQKTKNLKIKKNDISSFIIYIFLTLGTSA
jgi:hypothetical protein